MKHLCHPIWDICRELNGILRGTGYEVAPSNTEYYFVFKRVNDKRFNRGYRLDAIVKLSTIEAGKEFIRLNL